MANILILNGSPRKNGATASLINAFMEGAKDAGNDIRVWLLRRLTSDLCN